MIHVKEAMLPINENLGNGCYGEIVLEEIPFEEEEGVEIANLKKFRVHFEKCVSLVLGKVDMRGDEASLLKLDDGGVKAFESQHAQIGKAVRDALGVVPHIDRGLAEYQLVPIGDLTECEKLGGWRERKFTGRRRPARNSKRDSVLEARVPKEKDGEEDMMMAREARPGAAHLTRRPAQLLGPKDGDEVCWNAFELRVEVAGSARGGGRGWSWRRRRSAGGA